MRAYIVTYRTHKCGEPYKNVTVRAVNERAALEAVDRESHVAKALWARPAPTVIERGQ